MSDWDTFDGRVEPLAWGWSTYTIFRLPEDVIAALGKVRRVEGKMAEHPVNLALSRAPEVERVFLWTGQSLLDRIGITPGLLIEVRLSPAPDDRVDLGSDIEAALRSASVLDLRPDPRQASRPAVPDRNGKDRKDPPTASPNWSEHWDDRDHNALASGPASG